MKHFTVTSPDLIVGVDLHAVQLVQIEKTEEGCNVGLMMENGQGFTLKVPSLDLGNQILLAWQQRDAGQPSEQGVWPIPPQKTALHGSEQNQTRGAEQVMSPEEANARGQAMDNQFMADQTQA